MKKLVFAAFLGWLWACINLLTWLRMDPKLQREFVESFDRVINNK